MLTKNGQTKPLPRPGNQNTDSAGRTRVSEPFGIFDYKQIHSNHPIDYNELGVGTASFTYQYDRSSTFLAIGTDLGDRAVRQTSRYFPYVSGSPQVPQFTGIFAEPKAGLHQNMGYIDDLNGLCFAWRELVFGVLLRTSVSGSIVNHFTPQYEFNIDKLNGGGPSGIDYNYLANNIYSLDFRWLSTDTILYILHIDDKDIPVHAIYNANIKTSAFMKTPTLPLRYEIENVAGTASPSTMEQICQTVRAEGGYSIPGHSYSRGNGIAARSIGTTETPLLAVRLKNAFPTGEPNRKTLRWLGIDTLTTVRDTVYRLYHVKNATSVTGTWSDVGNDSGAEYSTDISAVTGGLQHKIKEIYAPAGQGSSGVASGSESQLINSTSYANQNIDSTNSEIFLITAQSFSILASCSASLEWVEFE